MCWNQTVSELMGSRYPVFLRAGVRYLSGLFFHMLRSQCGFYMQLASVFWASFCMAGPSRSCEGADLVSGGGHGGDSMLWRAVSLRRPVH